jgi:hypothetical protein
LTPTSTPNSWTRMLNEKLSCSEGGGCGGCLTRHTVTTRINTGDFDSRPVTKPSQTRHKPSQIASDRNNPAGAKSFGQNHGGGVYTGFHSPVKVGRSGRGFTRNGAHGVTRPTTLGLYRFFTISLPFVYRWEFGAEKFKCDYPGFSAIRCDLFRGMAVGMVGPGVDLAGFGGNAKGWSRQGDGREENHPEKC